VGGTRKDYGVPDNQPLKKLWDAIRNVRTGERPMCGLEAASSQTLCVNAMQDSMPEIRNFPKELRHTIEENKTRRVWVEGLDEALEACSTVNALPSELDFAWSAKGRRINLGTQYSFPNSAGS
jgi:hypothetical protein